VTVAGMMPPMDVACAWVAEEAERRTGLLALLILGLEVLPDELSGLGHLQQLCCSFTRVADR
jgi:hypothetical protein